MKKLPATLNIQDKICLIVGGGKVGSRKAKTLHNAGGQVWVLSSSHYNKVVGVSYIDARYDAKYLDELRPWLVVTATPDIPTNAQIQADAHQRGAIVMRADDASAGDVNGVMSRSQGGITITASSRVPTFSRFLLGLLETQITPEMVKLAELLEIERERLKTEIENADERGAIWKHMADEYPALLTTLAEGQQPDIRGLVESVRAKF